MACPKFVPSDVQMRLELISSGGFVVLLSEVKLQTFVMSVTTLKSSGSGVVRFSRGAPGLAGFRNNGADLLDECYSS